MQETEYQLDEAEKAEASDARMRWLEASGGERGAELAATQEEVEAIWFAGWEASRTAHVVHYGTEERHDRPRPFSHQHYHAHSGAAMPPDHTHGQFSHPHTHLRDDDHHEK